MLPLTHMPLFAHALEPPCIVTAIASAPRELDRAHPTLARSDHDRHKQTVVNKARRGRAPIAVKLAKVAGRTTHSTEEKKTNAQSHALANNPEASSMYTARSDSSK